MSMTTTSCAVFRASRTRLLAELKRLVCRVAFPQLDVNLFGNHLELVARGGPIDVDGNEKRPMTAFLKPLGQLSGGRCLTRALKSDKHQDGRRLRREIDADVLAAKHLDQFIPHDLYNLLSGTEALHHLLADRFGFYRIGELLHNLEVHIGFEQRHANFFQRFVQVSFGKLALAPQIFKYAL